MKLRIALPVDVYVEAPDGMSLNEIKRRVWDDVRDGSTTLWSGSGYKFTRGRPKRREVYAALDAEKERTNG
jgi:hypothetical protein